MVLPGRLKFPANGWSLRMYTASNPAADKAFQGDTARMGTFGSFQNQTKIIQFFRQRERNAARGTVFGFAPVERCTIVGAACAATQTQIDRHIRHLNTSRLQFTILRQVSLKQFQSKIKSLLTAGIALVKGTENLFCLR
jgi:hypothetical protein